MEVEPPTAEASALGDNGAVGDGAFRDFDLGDSARANRRAQSRVAGPGVSSAYRTRRRSDIPAVLQVALRGPSARGGAGPGSEQAACAVESAPLDGIV
jgi:hypothetical protein